ncbi:MAG: ASCH domain-containing protein [Desulfurococcales archaeon]|jgi:hypothetical protein|nr:ASCH domain-containing protein [Desulfurococcales archaeon]
MSEFSAKNHVKKFIGRNLMVRRKYGEMILKGIKTSTIRIGYIVPKKKEIIIHSGGKPIAKALIEEVLYKKLSELNDEDARREGFRNVKELIKELRKIYGRKLDKDQIFTIIRFRVTEDLSNLDPGKPYMGLDIRDIARLALQYLDNELDELEKKVLIMIRENFSIRAVSYKIFGDIEKRYIVRKILKKVLNILIERGIIGSSEKNDHQRSHQLL